MKEFSLLYIILNNLDFFYHRLDLLENLLFFSKENKILFQLIEQSLKSGNYNDINIDENFLYNINKFATVKHIVKKNDDNHSKISEIFEDIKKDLKTSVAFHVLTNHIVVAEIKNHKLYKIQIEQIIVIKDNIRKLYFKRWNKIIDDFRKFSL